MPSSEDVKHRVGFMWITCKAVHKEPPVDIKGAPGICPAQIKGQGGWGLFMVNILLRLLL